jgi:pyruvate dehydrogenase phosphatase
MSARSFGTFIDSEPSTPAYSPRVDYDWDDSTLVLLRPISSSSEPPSPTEPTWDMVVPMESSKQPTALYESAQKGPLATTRKPFLGTRLASPPVKKPKTPRKAQPAKEVQAADISQKENDDPHKDEENDKVKEHLEQPADSSTAPFGKLASKMKLMLRRRSATNDKKKEKREKDYYDPEENLHWSER